MTVLRSEPKPIGGEIEEVEEKVEEEEEEACDPSVPVGACATLCVCGVYQEPFGTYEDIETGQEVEATVYTLTCRRQFVVRITDYGATVVAIRAPDRRGVVKDLVFGFDDVQGYVQHGDHLLGGMVGRVAGRIPYARFCLGQAVYNISENVETDGPNRHHQDGGFHGLQHMRWWAHVPSEGGTLVLSVVHHDEEEGFPGAVLVQLRFQASNDHRLLVHVRADSTKPSLIGLRQGIMFNLAGHDAGRPDFMEHILTINADEYAVQTRRGTATGETKPVRRTALDFRSPQRLRKQHSRTRDGYQHMLTLNLLPPDGLQMVARLEHPESGRTLEIRSNQPCVHVYTGRRLPPWKPPKPKKPEPPPPDPEEESSETDPGVSQAKPSSSLQPSKSKSSESETKQEEEQMAEEVEEEEEEEDEDAVRGKDGVRYGSFCGIWLAPQWFPNAVHMDRFPKCVVAPAQTYEHVTVYRFYTTKTPARYSMAEEVVTASFLQATQEVEEREAQPPPPPPEKAQ